MKKIIMILFIIFLSLCLNSCDDVEIENNENILINEVCTNNGSAIATKNFKYVDYIELYNNSDKKVSLKNYGLSDDISNLYKYKFPNVSIEAKGYLIVFFDNDDIEEDLHAKFGLSDNGETIYLTMPNGVNIAKVKVPELKLNTSYGRYNDKYEVLNPSPNAQNESKPRYKYIKNPEFSAESGFYNNEFKLNLTSDDNVKIYYTLDSSIPTTESTLYTEPILVEDPSNNPNVLKARDDLSIYKNTVTSPVHKMFVVRAIAISDDGNKSSVITKTYFVNKNQYKKYRVVSLVTDESNLTDGKTGIYVKGDEYLEWEKNGSVGEAPEYNWNLEGRESERDCNLTYLNEGKLSFNQDCGMRIHGYGGRSILYKSFNIYARSNYGEKYFLDSMFETAGRTKSFILKYDRYSQSAEKFRDGFIQSLVKDRDVVTQDYEQCIVFINGEYWNTYSLMQKYSDDFIEDEYGVNKDNVVIIKDNKLDTGNKDDFVDYNKMTTFVKTKDMSQNINYNQFCEMVDIDSLIDLYAIQIYINNFDFSYKKNYLLWKTREKENNSYGDGKWRFMLYDFDYVATSTTITAHDMTIVYDYKFDTFTGVFLFATDFKDDIFFHNLMKNENFKLKFIQSFFDIANYHFSSSNVNNELYSQYTHTSGPLVEFFKYRFEYIKDHFANYLGTSNKVVNLTIQTTRKMQFNSLTLTHDFEGKYFYEYPLKLTDVDLNKCTLNDLTVIENKDGIITLKITGNNPKIIYN